MPSSQKSKSCTSRCASVNGYAALRADIERKKDKARHELDSDPNLEKMNGPDVWCLQAVIAALEELLKADARRMGVRHNDKVSDQSGRVVRPNSE